MLAFPGLDLGEDAGRREERRRLRNRLERADECPDVAVDIPRDQISNAEDAVDVVGTERHHRAAPLDIAVGQNQAGLLGERGRVREWLALTHGALERI